MAAFLNEKKKQLSGYKLKESIRRIFVVGTEIYHRTLSLICHPGLTRVFGFFHLNSIAIGLSFNNLSEFF